MVIDLENLSIQRHLYWPGIRLIRDVRCTMYHTPSVIYVSVCTQVIMMMEPNYPERVGKIIVINGLCYFCFSVTTNVYISHGMCWV